MELHIKKVHKKNVNLKDKGDDESRTSTTQTEEDRQIDIFKSKSINQLIFYFSIPAIISLLVESFASMIDTAFAGHLGHTSSSALSAMGIISPILSILIAAQLIFGVSTGIIVAKERGANNSQNMNNTFKIGLYSTIIFSSIISLIIFITKDNLLYIMGARGEIKTLANQYLSIAIIFNIFSSTGYTIVNNIRALGYPKIEIIIISISTLVNILFNFIFVFIFQMGIKGIALATLISEVTYTMISILFLIKKDLWIKESEISINQIKSILKSLLKIGFVQFLMQGLNSLNGLTVNKVLINYGEVLYIGSWAICNSIYMMLLLPLIGFTEGIQSVVAYYQGSRDEDKKNILQSKSFKYSLVYSVVIMIIISIFSRGIINLFTRDINIIESSINITRIMIMGLPCMGIIYTLIAFMQVSGEGENASKLELIRQVFLFIPLCMFLPIIVGKFNIINLDPGLGVFFAMPISNIISVIFYRGFRIR